MIICFRKEPLVGRIAVVKSSLKKVIAKAALDNCEMVKIIIQVEACLNSQPLTYLKGNA